MKKSIPNLIAICCQKNTLTTWLRSLSLLLMLSLLGNAAFAAIFVTPTGAGTHSGTSWADAKTLTEALSLGSTTDIWLQAGTHVTTSYSVNGSIYGGFVGTETTLAQRDASVNISIIEGTSLSMTGYQKTYDGFTMRNTFFGVKKSTIGNCIFDNVRIQLDASDSGNRPFSDCVFKNTTGNSPAVYMNGQYITATFTRCLFEDNNSGTSDGGAVYSNDAIVYFYECRFLNNSSNGSGGAIYINDAQQTRLVNCLFDGNTAASGGALYARLTDAGSHYFFLNTFVNNTATTGSGFYLVRDGTACNVDNNIIWDNSGSSQMHVNNVNPVYGLVTITNNLIETPVTGGGATVNSPISGDPQFNVDYSLKSCSPAINAGKTSSTDSRTTDIDGDTRVVGIPDLGCFEFQGTPFTASITADVTNICTGVATLSASSGTAYLWSNGATTSSIQVTNLETGTYTCDITSTDGCSLTSNSIEITSTVAPGTITGLDANYCTSAATVTLTGAPSGGSFSGPGISGNTFSPLTAGAGTHTIQYDYTDTGCTGSTTLSTEVIVDVVPPVLSCPTSVTGWDAPGSGGGVYSLTADSVTVQCEPGTCGATITYVTPTATDDCGEVTTVMTSGLASGAVFSKGTTTVTYVATDAAGLTDTCTFDVIIVDLESPLITCPANMVVSSTVGQCGATVSYTAPVGTDNCLGATTALIAGQGDGTFFGVGVNTETYEVTDAEGNANSCSFTITVEDNENPTITCPSDTAVNTVSGSCYIAITYDAPTGLDNCVGATTSLLSGLGTGSSFPAGDNVETYQVTDAAGNTASCSFTVSVTNTPPSISSIVPLNGPTTGGYPLTIEGTNFDTLASVTIGNVVCTNVVSTPTSITCTVPEGTGTNLPVTVANGPSNSNSVAFSYDLPVIASISGCVDQGNATFDCSMAGGDTITVLGSNLYSPTNVLVGALNGDSIISDLFNPHTSLTFTLPAGAGTKTVRIQTASGISNGVDMSYVECPAGTYVDSIVCTACVTGTYSPTANCAVCLTCPPGSYSDSDSSATCITCPKGYYQPNSGSNECLPCPLGRYNPSTGQTECMPCAQGTYSDTLAAVSCKPCEAGTSNPNLGAIACENCTPGSFTATTGAATCTDCPPGSFSATDSSTVCTTCPPGFIQPLSGQIACQDCPEDFYQVGNDHVACYPCPSGFAYAGPDQTICANTSATLTAHGGATSGISGGAYAWTGGPSTASYVVSPTVTTSYVVEVTDVNGCSDADTVQVIVADIDNPAITCVDDMVVVNDAGECYAVVNYSLPTTTDVCTSTPVIALSSGLGIGSNFPIGTNTETYTATDDAGNVATCNFDVTVQDSENPTVSCPSNIVVANEAGLCRADVSAVATVSDNCSYTLTNSFNATNDASGTYQVGTTNVSYTITDASGNTASCNFTVTVNDTEAPSLTACPDDTTSCDGTGISWTAPTADDNCGVSCFFSNFNPGDNFPAGENVVTYEVEDASGNTASCSFTVTINAAPTVTVSNDVLPAFCQGSSTLTADGGIGATYLWSSGETTASITPSTVGNYTVTVINEAGCESTASYQTTSEAEDILSSYTIIGMNEVKMNRNTVYSGGVGVTGPNRSALIQANSNVAAVGTFVKAADVSVVGGSVVTTQISGEAGVALPPYIGNPYNSNNGLTVNPGQTATLSDNSYGRVRAKRNATIIFTNEDVFVKELIVEIGAEVQFLQCTNVMSKGKIEFGAGSVVNADGYNVVFYAGGDVTVDERAKITASIYAPLNKIEVKESRWNNHTIMTGLFIAYEITSEYNVDWYAGTTCAPCAVGTELRIIREVNELENSEQKAESPMQMNAYPNPFNETVNIDFVIPESTTARVEIVTAEGIQVKVVYEGPVAAWELNSYNFQPTDMADGIYFYQITTASGKSEVRKLILAR